MAGASVAFLWFAFVGLNTLFIEQMSYEPDRILAFHRSGYATLQEWWHHTMGLALPTSGCCRGHRWRHRRLPPISVREE
jgi:hypothetical protein